MQNGNNPNDLAKPSDISRRARIFSIMKKYFVLLASCTLLFFSCSEKTRDVTPMDETSSSSCKEYLSYTDSLLKNTGGVKMVPIETDKGTFQVWTKQVGNAPKMRVLLLHGGPGLTHELFECFESYFPQAGIEFIYYDQLGSYYSDQPQDTSLWQLDRFVEEVEQVRIALNLNEDNFYLYGQSWGGILGLQYALKYQENMKGLIVSNMVPSLPEYQDYSAEVLAPMLDPEVQAEIQALEDAGDYSNPRYAELVSEHYYTEHILRRPLDEWPEPVNRSFNHINAVVYNHMQGPSEFGIKGDANLKTWDVKPDVHKIEVPILSIGAKHDTMDPEQMKWLAENVQNGTYLFCPTGSHLSQYDNPEVYFKGLIDFILELNDEHHTVADGE